MMDDEKKNELLSKVSELRAQVKEMAGEQLYIESILAEREQLVVEIGRKLEDLHEKLSQLSQAKKREALSHGRMDKLRSLSELSDRVKEGLLRLGDEYRKLTEDREMARERAEMAKKEICPSAGKAGVS